MRFSWIALLLVLGGCTREATPVYRRIVLVPLENLTSDGAANVDAQALRLGIWESLQAQPKVYASLAAHRRDLPDFGPALVVDGYVAPKRFHLQVNGQPVDCGGELGDCLGKLVAAVGTALQVTPRMVPKVESLRALAGAGESLEDAVKADPLIASLWLGWAGQAQGGALSVLEKAPLPQMSPYDAGRVRLRMAELQKDRKVLAKAMVEMAALAPADFELQERAARAAMAGRDFAAASGILERMLSIARHPQILNQLAYVAVYSGDRAKAESYATAAQAAAPNDPGIADTRGEVAYAFADYAVAAQAFEQAANLNVTFQGGLELWKAASAARREGDKVRAEALLQRYLDVRAKAGMRNPLIVQAIWEWHGDQAEQAQEKLRSAAQSTERGKALFLLGLMELNQRDFAAAERIRRELDPQSIESAFLRAVSEGTALPPGLPFPPEAVRALHLHLKGDQRGAAAALTQALEKMDPVSEGQWRKLDAKLHDRAPTGLMPPSPDDWLAVVLR